jgi:hypothetical protein
MGYRDRSSLSDLLSKQHRPIRPQNITKTVVINLVVLRSPIIRFNDKDCTYFSAMRLLAPITLLGYALSVDIITNFLTLYKQDRSARFLVPPML